MAKRKTSRKSKSRKKSKARKVVRVSVSATPKKATKSRKRKAVSGFTPKGKKMKKSNGGGKGLNGIIADVMDTAMGSGGAYAAEWGATKIPIASPVVKGLVLVAGGVLVKRMGLQAVGRGISYESGKSMLKQLLPIAGGANGIGSLTREEVDIIERTAMSDAVNGVTEQVVHGNANRSATELL